MALLWILAYRWIDMPDLTGEYIVGEYNDNASFVIKGFGGILHIKKQLGPW